jgi:L-threonylcarbamoyladenylate synthase
MGERSLSRIRDGGLRLSLPETVILQVNPADIGHLEFHRAGKHPLDSWTFEIADTRAALYLKEAAKRLRETDIPVAFPTETVYGLGADATRSSAVKGIYKAKQRPSDNPLIVHICSLAQLRALLRPGYFLEDLELGLVNTNSKAADTINDSSPSTSSASDSDDPIPSVYKPLIDRFWPGPLTILCPVPRNSVLAPEVTAGLQTFGVRMPRSSLALALIKLAKTPLAGPSANASTRPSPTTAAHVKNDLDGRIELILDGGSCSVGVESTVVDGLSDPPVILRPGGISIEQLRACHGWEGVVKGYKDSDEQGSREAPKAPGMKYKHYSPKATVLLHEVKTPLPSLTDVASYMKDDTPYGIIRTKGLLFEQYMHGHHAGRGASTVGETGESTDTLGIGGDPSFRGEHPTWDSGLLDSSEDIKRAEYVTAGAGKERSFRAWIVELGDNPKMVARGIFAALRELDGKGVGVILVEGISEEGDGAAAVMNRLRKASSAKIEGTIGIANV